MKKKFLATLLVFSLSLPLLVTQNVSASELPGSQIESTAVVIENATDTNTIEPLSTATYYYWRQTGSSYKYSNYISDWIEYNRPYASYTGQTYGMIFNHSQKGSVSIGISVAGKLFGGSLSYTPGSSASITGSATSQPLTGGKTYIAQYRKKELVYDIYQRQYLYDLGTDYDTNITKTGTQAFPTTPDARWILQ